MTGRRARAWAIAWMRKCAAKSGIVTSVFLVYSVLMRQLLHEPAHDPRGEATFPKRSRFFPLSPHAVVYPLEGRGLSLACYCTPHPTSPLTPPHRRTSSGASYLLSGRTRMIVSKPMIRNSKGEWLGQTHPQPSHRPDRAKHPFGPDMWTRYRGQRTRSARW